MEGADPGKSHVGAGVCTRQTALEKKWGLHLVFYLFNFYSFLKCG